jgi:hypothetical protein
MKFVLVVVLLFVVGGAALYYGGGYASFDPSEQGLQAKAALHPGMSWTEVIDVAREPQQYQPIKRVAKMVNGQEVESFMPGVPVSFDRNAMWERLEGGGVPWGFIFTYQFSHSVAFAVWFDGQGNVTQISDVVTMADLLHTRDQ